MSDQNSGYTNNGMIQKRGASGSGTFYMNGYNGILFKKCLDECWNRLQNGLVSYISAHCSKQNYVDDKFNATLRIQGQDSDYPF